MVNAAAPPPSPTSDTEEAMLMINAVALPPQIMVNAVLQPLA